MKTGTGSWIPLLTGREAAVARDIASSLYRTSISNAMAMLSAENVTSLSLSEGAAGALLGHNLCPADERDARWSAVSDHLWQVVGDALGRHSLPPSLFNGFVGPAWVLAHVDEGTAVDEFEDIDEGLLAYLKGPPVYGHDLMQGLVGIGLYALERSSSPRASEILELVVQTLVDTATVDLLGARWTTPPHLLPREKRTIYSHGQVNCGLAHGQPGILAFLAKAAPSTLDPALVFRTIDDGVRWLLSVRLPPGSPSIFPSDVLPDQRPTGPSRIGWCYGDLGIGLTLLRVAHSTDDRRLHSLAVDCLRAAASRSSDEATGIKDLGLCHGFAGAAHLFNRAYQATRIEEFRTAALGFYGRILATCSETAPDRLCFAITIGDQPVMAPCSALHTGTMGVAVALWAATGAEEPVWDRILLADVPSHPASDVRS